MSLLLPILREASIERHNAGARGFKDGTFAVTLTKQSEREIRALVRNGDHVEYGVTLTEHGPFCSCKDALYRGTICKHAVAVSPLLPPTTSSREEPDSPHVGIRRDSLQPYPHPDHEILASLDGQRAQLDRYRLSAVRLFLDPSADSKGGRHNGPNTPQRQTRNGRRCERCGRKLEEEQAAFDRWLNQPLEWP